MATNTTEIVQTGAIRYNTDSNKMECFNGTKWMQVAVSSPDLDGGARGLNMGGAPAINNIDYFTIPTAGNATDFGDLATARYLNGACSSRTRALTFGGNTPESNNIEYITIPSTGNGTSFGNLTSSKRNFHGGGNQTRGLMCGGLEPGSSYQDDIDYVTIASTGNAQDFGDSAHKQDGRAASGDSLTRGVFMGGRNDPSSDNLSAIEYITIATRGNTVSFGDLTAAKRFVSGTSDKIRALCCGGYTSSNQDVIEYVTTATLGDGVDFGNLNTSTFSAAAFSNAHGGL